jgi:Co/Zn/Cd efflux system component
VLGGLANACFLVAVSALIWLEGIERFISPADMRDTHYVIYVGAAGFVLNLFGLLLFRSTWPRAGYVWGCPTRTAPP